MKPLFSDHKRVGKKFIPPMSGLTEIHYTERILPEIVWMDFLVAHLGTRNGVEVVGYFIESCFNLRGWEFKPDFTCLSNFQILSQNEWGKFKESLQQNGTFSKCLDALTPFIHCYPTNNPFLNLFTDFKPREPLSSEVTLARQIASRLFDRRSREATLVQSIPLWLDIKLGKYHVLHDFPYRDFDSIFGDFCSPPDDRLSAHVRMHVNGNFMMHQNRISDIWAKYYWNRGRELTPIAAQIPIPRLEAGRKYHPVIRFGIDYESYAWKLVDEIWSKLPIDIFQSEFFEVLGALMARQCNLAVKLAHTPTLWDYHAGPLFLRAMTDSYITLAWIFKEPIDRAQKFILYGLGQEKLQIEQLKAALETVSAEDRKALEQRIEIQQDWLNSQHYSFLQHVDVGSWSGISTRKMAEEAGCLDLYNHVYTGWSHAAHGTWNHIGRFDAWPSQEALHKHIWQPANLDHGQHIDVVIQGTKYFDELCCLIVSEFKLKMTVPSPSDWLNERLNELFAEMQSKEASNVKSKTD